MKFSEWLFKRKAQVPERTPAPQVQARRPEVDADRINMNWRLGALEKWDDAVSELRGRLLPPHEYQAEFLKLKREFFGPDHERKLAELEEIRKIKDKEDSARLPTTDIDPDELERRWRSGPTDNYARLNAKDPRLPTTDIDPDELERRWRDS